MHALYHIIVESKKERGIEIRVGFVDVEDDDKKI